MYVMRAGPQLGVAKAARAPPCTLPILGRRFILSTFFIRLKLVDSLAISGNNSIYYDSSETSSIAFLMRAAAPPLRWARGLSLLSVARNLRAPGSPAKSP